ncbi:hypothetical protein U5A85_06730, partial [Priestia megaterium]
FGARDVLIILFMFAHRYLPCFPFLELRFAPLAGSSPPAYSAANSASERLSFGVLLLVSADLYPTLRFAIIYPSYGWKSLELPFLRMRLLLSNISRKSCKKAVET